MPRLLVIFSLFASSVSAGGVTGDMNCTYQMAGVNVFSPTAFACEDNVGATVCQTFFNAGAAVTAPYGPDDATTSDRPLTCYQTATPAAPSADIKDSAITLCPKFCGFCCVTPAYNCPNAPYPQIDCSKVNQKQCKDPAWTSIIAANCPNVCGFCLNGGCVDLATECTNFPTICSTSGLQSFVAANCQKTCGLCSSSTTAAATTASSGSATTSSTSSGSSSTCGNNSPNCANWVANGFCASSFYTQAQKMSYCGTSCGLCSGK